MCLYPNYGIRVLDYDTGAITLKFIGHHNFLPKDVTNGSSLGDLVQIPCGQCSECRVQKAREWSVRLIHEKQLHNKSCFLTLTYNDFYLPADGSLHKDAVQIFIKNLRRRLDYHHDNKIRYYACGEYGSKSGRPHYHMILFGEDFAFDRKEFGVKHGFSYFTSDTVSSVWPYGFHIIGETTYDSIFYVSKYVTKKITGKLAEFHYDGLEPEFALMSRRPGIGHDWLLKYSNDVYNFDEVVLRDLKLRPPAYYDRLFECLHPFDFSVIKTMRQERFADANNKLTEKCSDQYGFNLELYKNYFDSKEAKVKRFLSIKKGNESL